MSIVLSGTLSLALIGLAASVLLARAREKYSPSDGTVVETINRLLPQTQCAQCGYPGCRPYAEAISQGEAINRCPPGGDDTISALANLLGRPVQSLDPDCGSTTPPLKAVIREDECIGCTLCIQACPVDAIIGSQQAMHTVIETECTGCELCVPPCPVDCIDLIEYPEPTVIVSLPSHDECIRCGLCEPACPKDLLPESLYWYRDSDSKLTELALDDCIECRRCDKACPSQIPLTAYFRQAKSEVADRRASEARARYVEARYQRHETRMAARKVRVRPRPSRHEKASLLDAIRRGEQ